jgi:hypothetical protein
MSRDVKKINFMKSKLFFTIIGILFSISVLSQNSWSFSSGNDNSEQKTTPNFHINASKSKVSPSTDSLSNILIKRIEKMMAPIPLLVMYWIDSVPIDYNMGQKLSFSRTFNGWKEYGNNRSGYIKSDSYTYNLYFYAKISDEVNIYLIKLNMNFGDFAGLGEIPDKELSPFKLLTLKTLSVNQNNDLRFDEIIFYNPDEHYKYQNNKWVKID